jgi:polyhydroxybutyrate depolymerase
LAPRGRLPAAPAERGRAGDNIDLGLPPGAHGELITISGAGHQWPGSRPRTAAEKRLGLDPSSTALDATDVIWTFLERHPASA